KAIRLDWTKLCNPHRQQEFQIALFNRFEALIASNNVEEEEQRIADTIIECAKPLCPPTRHRTQPWISDECLNLVAQRKQAKIVDYNRYRQLNHEVRRKLKEEREKYRNDMASQLEEEAAKHEYRTLYRAIRRLSGKRHSLNDNIKKADGTFVR
ncbi:hypothetical protein, partial [Acinetobacter baumannii]|uniref:hypothetical protein n=1 Tax=Acinetobacter baumannii TaxID=470 RepID=UPI003394CE3E